MKRNLSKSRLGIAAVVLILMFLTVLPCSAAPVTGVSADAGLQLTLKYLTATQPSAAQSYTRIYSQALQDAMLAKESDICHSLVSIDPASKNLLWRDGRVLVVTWTKYPESYPVGTEVTTYWGDTWVTAVPELKDFITSNNLSPLDTLRVEQLLGLPPGSGYKSFAELWVKPADLFRPAPDNEINDTWAGLAFNDSVSDGYKTWFNNNILSLYFGNKKCPWTRLGYTYDWGNPRSKIGLSEFVIKKGAVVTVNSLQSNEDYINPAPGAPIFPVSAQEQPAAFDPERRMQLDTVFQVSTINALLQGLYDGVITCGDLKNRGNFGIGVFAGLDGEMVELDNNIYQIKADGKVYCPGDEEIIPFATVTFFETDSLQPVKNINTLDNLQQMLDKMITNKNYFYAVRLDGVFNYVKTRSVPGQEKPYPPLAKVTASQPTFEYKNIKGAIVGFWCPQYVEGISVPGYHLHFISEDRTRGGHLLECGVVEGLVRIDSSADFHMMLPEGDDFSKADLVADRSEEIKKVEK